MKTSGGEMQSNNNMGGGEMTAIVLLKANPGAERKAYNLFKRVAVNGIKIKSRCHVYGRFDGVVFCEYTNPKRLNAFCEALRKGGVFHTETMIAID